MKTNSLFVTDAQTAERIGITTDQFKSIVDELDRQGFPPKDPLFFNRRYWPAVRAWLDNRYGLGGENSHGPYPLDGKETWK